MTMLNLLNYVLVLIPVLVNVAFITLLERKILGYSQLRVGPTKVGVIGVGQPFADAVKLFIKETEAPTAANQKMYYASPVAGLFLVLLLWSLAPSSMNSWEFEFSGVLLLVIMSFGVYPLLLAGWASNSKYALIGGLRGVAQTVSYEISLALFLLCLFIYVSSLQFAKYSTVALYTSIWSVLPFLLGLWLLTALAETNRTPFDFAEGESELVSGFNVEYASGGFALIFMAEYASIYFLSWLSVLLFFGSSPSGVGTQVLATGFVFFWVWARATLPRYRYDMLMNLAWKSMLPVAVGLSSLAASVVMVLA